jgi:beta-glucosidase
MILSLFASAALALPNPAMEARIDTMVGRMTLAQKVGQMTQPEIKTATPDDVRKYHLGSVLNGGGSWPKGNKYASAADWNALAQAYHAASMQNGIPVIWGIDAIHGNSNVYGATLFPHNIGLGAARDTAAIKEMGAAVGKAVRATGIRWVFAPTVAVVRDDRWGRTYEGFSEDQALVADYASAYVAGLQGDLRGPSTVVATAKHFLGDGGTDQGKDQGVTKASHAEMMRIHAAGYETALKAGAQTVMASYNSWHDVAGGVNYGKLHGSKALLTDLLKTKMGFDGFVVSDWNGIGQVPGCRNDSCAQAINAGIDMVMVPDDWKAFIANTIAQVERGEIPMARIDDAVRRILRVKLRAGLFDTPPGKYAGSDDALQARALARKLVRESLVLLKHDQPMLPFKRGARLLVVGKGADSLALQNGGWTLTWQGTDNRNSDFPHGDTLLAGLREHAGKVVYSADAKNIDVSGFDAVVAIIGETPYAEGNGDIGPADTLRHSSRYPEDLAVLRAVAGKGKPVLTVLLSGRPLWINDLLNLSDALVAAWLPGTEGKGVADVLFGKADFRGRLSFSWPKSVCQTSLNIGDSGYAPLFALGYGLTTRERRPLGQLDASFVEGGCGSTDAWAIDPASNPHYLVAGERSIALGADLNTSSSLPGIAASTVQVNTQQDGKRITWTGPARFEARAIKPAPIPAYVLRNAVLRFDTVVYQAPAATVKVSMHCGAGCSGVVDLTSTLRNAAGKGRQTISVPLACFAGLQTKKVDIPFSIASEGAFSAAFANIHIAAESKAGNCPEQP